MPKSVFVLMAVALILMVLPGCGYPPSADRVSEGRGFQLVESFGNKVQRASAIDRYEAQYVCGKDTPAPNDGAVLYSTNNGPIVVCFNAEGKPRLAGVPYVPQVLPTS